MTKPPAAPDPPPEAVGPAIATRTWYKVHDQHEQHPKSGCTAFAPTSKKRVRFHTSTVCSSLVQKPPKPIRSDNHQAVTSVMTEMRSLVSVQSALLQKLIERQDTQNEINRQAAVDAIAFAQATAREVCEAAKEATKNNRLMLMEAAKNNRLMIDAAQESSRKSQFLIQKMTQMMMAFNSPSLPTTIHLSPPSTPNPDSSPVIFPKPTPPTLPKASISPANHDVIVPPISTSSFVSTASIPSNMASITPIPAPQPLSHSLDHTLATVTSKKDTNRFTITTPAASQSQPKSPPFYPFHTSSPDLTPSFSKAQTIIPLTPPPFRPPPPVIRFLSSPLCSYSCHATLCNNWPFIASSLSLLSRFPLDNFPDHPG